MRAPGLLIQGLGFLGAFVLGIFLSARPGPWKACTLNGRSAGCRYSHDRAGVSRIALKDHGQIVLRIVDDDYPVALFIGRSGDLWDRDLYLPGKVVFVRRDTGYRIVIPVH
jgi:hypothetical protein